MRAVLSSVDQSLFGRDLTREAAREKDLPARLYSEVWRILAELPDERPEHFFISVTPAVIFPFDLRLKLIWWLLQGGEKSLIKLKDAYRYPLTEPMRKWIPKLVSDLPPTRAERFSSLGYVYELLNVDPPEYGPDPFTALDLLLLLPSKVSFDFLSGGRAMMAIPLATGEAEVEVYRPPLAYEFPDLDFGRTYVRITPKSG
ncbi:MAG: hypothetical protein ACPLRW_10995 [Moorellales bacterium]